MKISFLRSLLVACCGVMMAFYGCDGGAYRRTAIESVALVVGLLAGAIGAVLMLAAVIRYARNG